MVILFFILLLIACAILGFIVLIQNPKGGGLSGQFGGFSNQLMGVKQTTDVLEKGTWIFAAVIGILCLVSTAFIKGGSTSTNVNTKDLPSVTAPAAQPAPAGQQATPVTPAPGKTK
jgi:preprotein translocase subunit SecG